MSLVETVLTCEAPVAFSGLNPTTDDTLVLHQLTRQLVVDGRRRLVGDRDVHPHQTESLLDRIGLDVQLAADLGIRTVGDDRGQLAVSEPVRPAVVRAADSSRELLIALGQRNAVVRAPIVQGICLACVADDRQLFTTDGEALGVFGDVVRPRDRVPVTAVSAAGCVVTRPCRPILPTGRSWPLGQRERGFRRLDTSHVKSSRH